MVRRISALRRLAGSGPAARTTDDAVARANAGRVAPAIAVVVVAGLIIALATGLVAHPSAGEYPLPSSPPVSVVLSYALTWRDPADDPPVVLPSGLAVKSSNYRGVVVGGDTYYYNLAPNPTFDPLARREVTRDQIDVVAVVGDPPNRVMIYTIRRGCSSTPGEE